MHPIAFCIGKCGGIYSMHEININRFNGLEKRKTILSSPILGIGLVVCWHITLFSMGGKRVHNAIFCSSIR